MDERAARPPGPRTAGTWPRNADTAAHRRCKLVNECRHHPRGGNRGNGFGPRLAKPLSEELTQFPRRFPVFARQRAIGTEAEGPRLISQRRRTSDGFQAGTIDATLTIPTFTHPARSSRGGDTRCAPKPYGSPVHGKLVGIGRNHARETGSAGRAVVGCRCVPAVIESPQISGDGSQL